MMKTILMLILLTISFQSNAGDVLVFAGFFSYDDNETRYDYNGLSPNGYYGIKYRHNIDEKFSIEAGFKHESSTKYKEQGKGFNGLFFGAELKVF